MTVAEPGRMRPRILFPDWVWALVCWTTGAGYFMLSVTVGTTFFFADVSGPDLEPLPVWSTLAIITAQAIPIAWATRFPRTVFWIVFALFQLSVVVIIDRALLVTPSLLFAVFTVAAMLPVRAWRMQLTVAVGIDLLVYLTIGVLAEADIDLLALITVLLLVIPPYAFALLAGKFYASQRTRAALEADRADALRVAADVTRTAAIAAERTRIAREFHDIAAHHLSSIVVSSTSAIALDDAGSALSRELLASIRSESELAMDSMREVIGLLREERDDAPDAASVPELRDSLTRHVDAARRTGQSVHLRIEGEVDDLPVAASLACYRIVQESLTNARKHAPGAHVMVRVERTSNSLIVTVANAPTRRPPPDPAGPRRPGFGLLGMRERAATLGGSLTSGEGASGGWETRAILPLDAPLDAPLDRQAVLGERR